GGLQGSLLLLFGFHKKLHRNGNTFLLLYIGVLLLQLTLKVMSKIWLMENWSLLYSLSHNLPLLYGPLIYLFVKERIMRFSFAPKDLLHFLPFGVVLFFTFLSAQEIAFPFEFILSNPHVRFVLLGISLGVYHYFAYQTSGKYIAIDQNKIAATPYTINWVKKFVVVSAMVCSLIATALYLLFINYPNGHEYRYGFVSLTLFIYWISYSALTEPILFSIITTRETNPENIPRLVVHRQVKKYARSTLDVSEKERISNALSKLVDQDKIYLDTELTIDSLAEKINCSRHALSQVLNECMGQSFYDFVNQHRVQQAKALLLDVSRKDHKISSIAYDSGFNSLSTFNEVFKKLTGCPPSQFLRYAGERQRV
ncbi:MAG TPA: helix-turn-helix domain-containing protein, partial [Flavitalea sp.]|nr:helix-turn-helix domain-containing protein [Flavitalea sp.]